MSARVVAFLCAVMSLASRQSQDLPYPVVCLTHLGWWVVKLSHLH